MQTYQKQARRRVDAQVAQITKQILATYEDALKSINAELQKLYANQLAGVDPADFYNEAIKFDRLTKLKAQVTDSYTKASVKAGRLTQQASSVSMNEAYYQSQYVIANFAPTVGKSLSFTLLPPQLAELSITGNIEKWAALEASIKSRIISKYGPIAQYIPKDGQTLSALLATNRRLEVQKLNQAITSGLLQGNSYQQTARGVAKVIGSVGRTKSTGAMANALRIVRTESNRTYNAGAFANTQAVADQGIEIRRIWVASLDSRTRDAHASLDGQSVGVDEPFKINGETAMYPGDFSSASLSINCRCTVVEAVNGVPPSARRGVNPLTGESEVFDWKSYDEWKSGNLAQ